MLIRTCFLCKISITRRCKKKNKIKFFCLMLSISQVPDFRFIFAIRRILPFLFNRVKQPKITMQVNKYICKNNKITRTGLESYSEAHRTLHSLISNHWIRNKMIWISEIEKRPELRMNKPQQANNVLYKNFISAFIKRVIPHFIRHILPLIRSYPIPSLIDSTENKF